LQLSLPIGASAAVLLWFFGIGDASAQDNVKQGETPKAVGFDFTPPGKVLGVFEPRSKAD
jgi:hypothetical protein